MDSVKEMTQEMKTEINEIFNDPGMELIEEDEYNETLADKKVEEEDYNKTLTNLRVFSKIKSCFLTYLKSRSRKRIDSTSEQILKNEEDKTMAIVTGKDTTKMDKKTSRLDKKLAKEQARLEKLSSQLNENTTFEEPTVSPEEEPIASPEEMDIDKNEVNTQPEETASLEKKNEVTLEELQALLEDKPKEEEMFTSIEKGLETQLEQEIPSASELEEAQKEANNQEEPQNTASTEEQEHAQNVKEILDTWKSKNDQFSSEVMEKVTSMLNEHARRQEDLLNERYSEIINADRVYYEKQMAKLSQFSEEKISGLVGELKDMTASRDDYQNKFEADEKIIASQKATISDRDNTIEGLNKVTKSQNNEITDLKRQLVQKEKTIEGLKIDIKDCDTTITKLTSNLGGQVQASASAINQLEKIKEIYSNYAQNPEMAMNLIGEIFNPQYQTSGEYENNEITRGRHL